MASEEGVDLPRRRGLPARSDEVVLRGLRPLGHLVLGGDSQSLGLRPRRGPVPLQLCLLELLLLSEQLLRVLELVLGLLPLVHLLRVLLDLLPVQRAGSRSRDLGGRNERPLSLRLLLSHVRLETLVQIQLSFSLRKSLEELSVVLSA